MNEDLVGLTLRTGLGYVDLVAVEKVMQGARVRLNAAERAYLCEHYGITPGNLRKLRWERSRRLCGQAPQRTDASYGTAYTVEAETLRGRPGEWVALFELPSKRQAADRAADIRRGRLTQFRPAGAFEARAVAGTVWARYKGVLTGGALRAAEHRKELAT